MVLKGDFLPTSYPNIGVIKPCLFIKFRASKHSGNSVTQTCMPYCNVWAEVIYRGFPKSKVFTNTLICLFPACHQTLYLYIPSFICGCTLVSEIREFKQKKKMNNSENGYFEFDTYGKPIYRLINELGKRFTENTNHLKLQPQMFVLSCE